MPATAVAVAAYQTNAVWNLTATAMWWAATSTPSPAAVAGLGEAEAIAQPNSSQFGGLLLLMFFAGALVAGIPAAALTIRHYRDAGTPLPDPMRPSLFRRYGDTQWIDDVRPDVLVGKGISPRQAASIVESWGEPIVGNGHTTWNHVTSFWRHIVIATLVERGMLRGDAQPTARAVVAPDRVIYILDMANLGGIRYEQWLDARFIEQMRAASGGCRVTVTGEGGIAVQIGIEPEPVGEAEPGPLPTLAPLDLARRPAYSIGFGVSCDGALWAPLESLGHIMVSGSTGSGKSYFLRSLVYQLITLPPHAGGSQTVSLYLADRAGNVFTPLDAYQVPQLAEPVAKTPAAVVELLRAATIEMQRREQLFDAEFDHFPDKLAEYNAIPGVEPLPRMVVIVDEVTVLVAEAGGEKGEVHRALLALAAQGRKYGLTLVVAGQDFKASTFNTALTHQLLTRVAFKAGSVHESRVVIEEEGAERLRGAGHGLLRYRGRLVEFQGFFVEKAALIARCKAIGTEPGPHLSDLERELVQYALEELDGAFTRSRLSSAGLMDDYPLRKLIDEWRSRGWLVMERRQRGVTEQDILVVSPVLAAMVRSEK